MEHRHEQDTWEGYSKVSCSPIGEHVCMRQTGRHGKPAGYVAGFIIAHDVTGQDVARCEGAITVDPELARNGKVWTMTGSLAGGDLSLHPSIQCTTHPEFHAYVSGGRWTG